MITPSTEQALHLALMLHSGMPSYDAIRYFIPPDEGAMTEPHLKAVHDGWMGSSALRKAVLEVQGKPWQDLSFDARLRFAIDKHYNELAYFIYSHHYANASGVELTKLNQARTVLEAKLAGTAGQGTAMERFWADITSGKVKLTPAAVPTVVPLAVMPA